MKHAYLIMWLGRLSQDAGFPCDMNFQDSKVDTVGVCKIPLQVSAILTWFTNFVDNKT